MKALLMMFIVVGPAYAQETNFSLPKLEFSARAGLGTLKLFGSDYTDSGSNVGLGVAVRIHRRWLVEFEADRMANVDPLPVPCGLAVACSGEAVQGVKSAYHFSANLLYHFPASRLVQPYVLGGVGSLHSRKAEAVTFASRTAGNIVQLGDSTDRGVSIGFGAGLRIHAGRRISIRPEFRLYDGTLRARNNLTLIQSAAVIGYRW